MPIKSFKQTQLPVFILQTNLETQSKKIDMFYGFRNVVKQFVCICKRFVATEIVSSQFISIKLLLNQMMYFESYTNYGISIIIYGAQHQDMSYLLFLYMIVVYLAFEKSFSAQQLYIKKLLLLHCFIRYLFILPLRQKSLIKDINQLPRMLC